MPLEMINGIKIYHEVSGNGEPILFIMGLGADYTGWKYQVEFFKHKYKVIVFDNRGIGRSDKPLLPYSIKTMAHDSVLLLNHLNITKAHIIGISMGGMIAQEIALNWPLRVNKMVIANSYAKDTKSISSAVKYSSGSGILGLFSKGKLIDFLMQNSLSEEFARENPAVIEGIKEKYQDNFSLKGFLNQYLATKRFDSSVKISSLSIPTLVIAGSDDRMIPLEYSQFLADNIPGAQIKIIEGGSHAMNWEQADQFNRAVLDFIKS
jgi:3-oxoadipate enol-lactonase